LGSLLVEADGYVLRIKTEKWVNQVFSMTIYYTSLRRRWKPSQTIVFLHKTNVGDAIIGYGEIENIYDKSELSDEEIRECEKYGWKKAIVFKYVKPLKPLPIKETFLKDLGLSGKYLHGLKLNKEQMISIIDQAERLQS
jgi:hypothetical protein